MTRDQLIAVLTAYRRPGTPSFGRHFMRLPRAVVQADNVSLLLDILWDDGLPGRVRDHAAGALGETGDVRAVAAHRAVVEAALADVKKRREQARPVEPERPWDHAPGTLGWFAECDRARTSLTRLLAILE
ncbi:MAG: hypothetical protein WDA75_04110 [Candidatus Latescibacterota bacterium]|jgi:hypothetical protein